MMKIKVGIFGASGYAGMELLRLLLRHPHVEVHAATSRQLNGQPLSTVFSNLTGEESLTFSTVGEYITNSALGECDVVFFATPHGVAMEQAKPLLDNGIRVIDLGADFRIKDATLWSEHYQLTHSQPDLLTHTVYGLTELNRQAIRNASLIANPGCYPTAVLLALAPLINDDCIDVNTIIADCKSGISGAGRKAKINLLLCENAENTKAYGVNSHRHLPEMTQELNNLANKPVSLTFIPHLLPMKRGLYATIYVDCHKSLAATQQILQQHYQHEYFINVLPMNTAPETRSVQSSNFCHIGVAQAESGKMVVMCAIDNLVKGAAGQAIQNMNIMFSLDETSGLEQLAVVV